MHLGVLRTKTEGSFVGYGCGCLELAVSIVWVCSHTRQNYLVLSLIKNILLLVNSGTHLSGIKAELVSPRHHINNLSLIEHGLHLVGRVCRYRLRA